MRTRWLTGSVAALLVLIAAPVRATEECSSTVCVDATVQYDGQCVGYQASVVCGASLAFLSHGYSNLSQPVVLPGRANAGGDMTSCFIEIYQAQAHVYDAPCGWDHRAIDIESSSWSGLPGSHGATTSAKIGVEQVMVSVPSGYCARIVLGFEGSAWAESTVLVTVDSATVSNFSDNYSPLGCAT